MGRRGSEYDRHGQEPSGKVWIVDTSFGVISVWRITEAMGVGETD